MIKSSSKSRKLIRVQKGVYQYTTTFASYMMAMLCTALGGGILYLMLSESHYNFYLLVPIIFLIVGLYLIKLCRKKMIFDRNRQRVIIGKDTFQLSHIDAITSDEQLMESKNGKHTKVVQISLVFKNGEEITLFTQGSVRTSIHEAKQLAKALGIKYVSIDDYAQNNERFKESGQYHPISE
jgi:hypothetical protein